MHNILDLQSKEDLDDAETTLLADAYRHFSDLHNQEKFAFDIQLLFKIHKYFLSPLYAWAGKVRTVDMSKDGMLFAPVAHIQSALDDFEKILAKNIPSLGTSKKSTAMQLAIVHCEFNAIHPFREGNGRTIRLFLDLAAVRAGYDLIDWSKRSQKTYINACIDGMAGRYTKMTNVIFAGLAPRK